MTPTDLPDPWTRETPATFGLYWLTLWHESGSWTVPFLVQFYPGTTNAPRPTFAVVPLGQGPLPAEYQEGCDYYADMGTETHDVHAWAPAVAPVGPPTEMESGDPTFDVTVRALADVEVVVKGVRAPDEETARDYAIIQAEEGGVSWEYKGVVDDARMETTNVRRRT